MKDDTNTRPIFTREDCPNKIVEWLDRRQAERDAELTEMMYKYHLEVLDIKQKVIDNRMFIRLSIVAILALFVITLTGC
jgi:hypothetical protein